MFSKKSKENNNFSFLDVNITKTENNIETTVFKKQTNTR